MGFSIKLAPGVRLRASSRGLRASVGPRAARAHIGGGSPDLSTGAGPVSFYTSLEAGRSRARSGGKPVTTANYERELARRRREDAQADGFAKAQALVDTFKHIIELHRSDFPPVSAPVAPPPVEPNRAAIQAQYEREALVGIGMFKRAERAQARQRAGEMSAIEAQRQWAAACDQHRHIQAALDDQWQKLCANDPAMVLDTLREAFEDNEMPSVAVDLTGGEVSLALLAPKAEEAVPDQWPDITQTGKPSFRKMGKGERADYYTFFVCGHTLVTVREALAVAPGIRSARIAALRIDGHGAYGQPRVSCLLAAKFERSVVDGVQWHLADSAAIVSEASSELMLKQSGSTRELVALDLTREPELQALVDAIDFGDSEESSSQEQLTRKPQTASDNISTDYDVPSLTEACAIHATARREVEDLFIRRAESGEEVEDMMQSVVQAALDATSDAFGDIGDPVVREVQAGGPRERIGRKAIPYVEQAMEALQAVVDNSKDRDPHDLLDDCTAVTEALAQACRVLATRGHANTG